MKIRVAERSELEYVRETKRDKFPEFRNYDPALHPFQKEREYSRAVASAKIERLLAKPFIAAFPGHKVQIKMMAKHFTRPNLFLSVDVDGTAKMWDATSQSCCYTTNIKKTDSKNTEDFLSAATFAHHRQKLITTSKLGLVHFWQWGQSRPVNTIETESNIDCIDHQFDAPLYATGGDEIRLWDESRSSAVQSFSWGPYNTHHVKFNNVQSNIIAGCTLDKGVVLYDTKSKSLIRKLVMNLETNMLAWNPMEAFYFTVACDDYNLHTFDMRNLDRPLIVHMDHIGPINSVDYDPTGNKIISGSDDRMIRIFNVNEGRSHEVYHTKRMRQVDSVCWSNDNKTIISGSRDSNIRLWRPSASNCDKILTPREKASRDYANVLKDTYQHHPEVKKIIKHRHVPKLIFNEKKHLENMRRADNKKAFNRYKNSKSDLAPSEKEKHVEKVEE